MKSKRFTDEFKSEAVKQVLERGNSVIHLSRQLGISEKILYSWLKAAKKATTESVEENIQAESNTISDKIKPKKKKFGALSFVTAFILLSAIITNPDEAEHRSALINEYNTTIIKEFGDSFLDVLFGGMGETILMKNITRDSYVLFSCTVLNTNQTSHVIGIGFFDQVILLEDIETIFDDIGESSIKKESSRTLMQDLLNL
ncbi:MAG: transposase [FCB group bacterium]|nr:transposase [FCB group bacterium]